jgi:hypothetical protein
MSSSPSKRGASDPPTWVELVPRFDRFIDIRHLGRTRRADIVAAIQQYAKTGQGGQIAYLPPGSRERDVLHAADHEVDFIVDREVDPPVMVVTGIDPIKDETEPD